MAPRVRECRPSYPVPMSEHPSQSQHHNPSEQTVHQRSTGECELNPVSQTSVRANRRKFMPMGPPRKGTRHLLIRKQAVLFICGVLRHPAKQSHA